MTSSLLRIERQGFHARLLKEVLTITNGVLSNADVDNALSKNLSRRVADILGTPTVRIKKLPGQTLGNKFEDECLTYIKATFLKLRHMRPGDWRCERITRRSSQFLAGTEQYSHLEHLQSAATKDPDLAAALGHDYSIAPDLAILRMPEPDDEINRDSIVVDDDICLKSGMRRKNNELPLLHASISCKFTLRSDRSQNARSEALNYLRNRKGRTPHIVVVTAECLPSRLASIGLGTGDIDCLYHIALTELVEVVARTGNSEAIDMLHILVHGNRIRDISDLPLDLTV